MNQICKISYREKAGTCQERGRGCPGPQGFERHKELQLPKDPPTPKHTHTHHLEMIWWPHCNTFTTYQGPVALRLGITVLGHFQKPTRVCLSKVPNLQMLRAPAQHNLLMPTLLRLIDCIIVCCVFVHVLRVCWNRVQTMISPLANNKICFFLFLYTSIRDRKRLEAISARISQVTLNQHPKK